LDDLQGIEQQLMDIAELTYEQTFDWEFWFQHLPTQPVNPDNITLFTVRSFVSSRLDYSI
jgi:hypothetical protein